MPWTGDVDLSHGAHRDALAAGRFVRVVNYHSTPASGREALRTELAAYAGRYRGIDLAELDGFFATGAWASDAPGFLPVFYEGYRTGHDVVAPVCEELGLTAWFMVCTGFVDCPPAQQEAFARSHWIGLTAEELAAPGERVALDWDEVGALAQRHVVTPHTASHDGIADVVTDDDLEREVLDPKRRMDAATGQSAPAFVWLHGTPHGASPRHDAAVREAGYRYQFSNTAVQRIG